MTGSVREMVKTLLYYSSVFFIVLTFLLYLTVMYDNEVGQYREYGFDYLILDFDEAGLAEIQNRPGVQGCYPARLVCMETGVTQTAARNYSTGGISGDYTSSAGSAEKGELDVYLADRWDEDNLSFWGSERITEVSEGGLTGDSIILDALTAKAMHAHIGDELAMEVGSAVVTRRLDMLVKPEFCLNDNIAVCLYDEEMQQVWEEQFPKSLPEYSVLFVRAEQDQDSLLSLDSWLYTGYAGPIGSELSQEEREIYNRSAVVRKEWFKEDSVAELQFTPPAALAVCALGTVLVFALIWHENRKKLRGLRQPFAVSVSLGMPYQILMHRFVWTHSIIIAVTAFTAAFLVKWLFYDMTVSVYYLTTKLLWQMAGAVSLTGILLSVISVEINQRQFGADHLYEQLRSSR